MSVKKEVCRLATETIDTKVTETRGILGMKQIKLLSKLQVSGVEISVPALSLLQSQQRPVTDIELNALS